MGGTLGYGVKSFYGYLQTKQKYQLSLTESLYYQNLDNNAGALFRLLNEAEEQEFREAALAYFFLLTRAGAAGWNREHLDDAIEEFLEQTAKIKVDFEIGDAVDKLVHFQLVENRGDGLLYAVPLREAPPRWIGSGLTPRTSSPVPPSSRLPNTGFAALDPARFGY